MFQGAIFDAGGVLADSPHETAWRESLRKLMESGWNRPVAGVPGVITDSQRGARRAVEHLAELGHRKFTYVADPGAGLAGAR